MRFALIVEYEGTKYHGFQFQINAPSIQEELEKAIARFTNERSRIKAASRTDAGVHAKAQVVAFDTRSSHSPDTFVKALNFYLPDEIAVKSAYKTNSDFDPRRMALSRIYRYTIIGGPVPSPLMRRTSYHLREPLNVWKMRKAARSFVGKHDFAQFTASAALSKTKASSVRKVYNVRIRQSGEIISLDVEGNAFLPHQIRRMAGALIDVGRGHLKTADLASMIDGKTGSMVAHTMPSRGLCLLKVKYAGFPPKGGELDDNKR